jgi:hypothetical protein
MKFKPYRWAWIFFCAQGVCAFLDFFGVASFHWGRLWTYLFIAWVVCASLGFITEYIDHAVSSLKTNESTSGDSWDASVETESEDDAEEREPFSFYYNDGIYDGTVNLTPTKRIYENKFYGNGPPTYRESYEYTLKEKQQIFARLIDSSEEDLNTTTYQVVNGQVQRDTVKQKQHELWSRMSAEDEKSFTTDALNKLDTAVGWHEVIGSIRYFILSKHGVPKEFFADERERLQTGFAKVEAAALKVGVQRNEYGWYTAPKDDGPAEEAIARLVEDARSERYSIKLREIVDYEWTIETLDRIIGDKIGDSLAEAGTDK